MKRIILTGATGFVGANLARKLLKEGHQIHILVRSDFSAKRIEAIRNDMQFHVVEFLDKQKLGAEIKKIKPDWVFHLAASGAYSWQTDLTQMIQTNILGTINLVEACLQTGFDTFINTGSSSEYGFKRTAPTETEWLEPNSHYAVTKASATLFCRHTAQSRGVRLFTLRLYSAFGPFEDPKRLMPSIIRQGLLKKFPPLVNPEIARDYVYIDDVVSAYLITAEKSDQESGAVYNIGSGIQTTMQEVVNVSRKVFGITDQPQWGSMPQRIWDTNSWIANNQKAKIDLGWQPCFTFEQGFQKMVEWVSNQNEYPI
jgi:dolichol-phosphate mannosyltransferase